MQQEVIFPRKPCLGDLGRQLCRVSIAGPTAISQLQGLPPSLLPLALCFSLRKAHLSAKISNRLKKPHQNNNEFGFWQLLIFSWNLPLGTELEGAGHGQRAGFSLCVMPELAFQYTWKAQPDCRDRWGMDEVLPLLVIRRLYSVCQLQNN